MKFSEIFIKVQKVPNIKIDYISMELLTWK